MVKLDDAAYNLVMAVPQHRKKFFVFIVSAAAAGLYVRQKLKEQYKHRASASETLIEKKAKNSKEGQKRVGVDAQFIAQLRKLAPICVPGPMSKEFGLLISLAGILVLRSGLDIWFSNFNGVVVKSIVTKDWNLFLKNAVILFSFMMWPLSVVNSCIKFNINLLALAIRTRLMEHSHNQYLKAITFYKVANLDNRIQNADQLLTQDIEKFSESMTHLYSDVAKPVVDIFLFAYALGRAISFDAPLMLLAYFMGSGLLLRSISPPFGKYTSIEQNLEGELRFNHSRIIAHSEEIAFYRGAETEKKIALSTYARIKRHLRKVYLLHFGYGIFDSIMVKYLATQLSWFVVSIPVFRGKGNGKSALKNMAKAEKDSSDIMEEFSSNFGYLINLAQAIGRLVLAGRDLTRFAGYTSRVSEFFDVLEDINNGRYQRTMVSDDVNGMNEVKTIDQNALDGKVIEKDGLIEFINVPICTPNGDVLVSSMSFKVVSGMNCLITGPNGCGKSSLFRILGGIWPTFGGTLIKPSARNMFYVPQKPYLTLGTLRDQLIYPDSQGEAKRKGFEDGELMALLGKVNLEYLVSREGGWDSVRDWSDVLSGGEKQRVAMARLFYHRPQFAILDECTSAVSIDVEGKMYRYAKELGITLFTVSHRPSLVPFHDYLLRFDGMGNYEFLTLSSEHKENFSFIMNRKPSDASTTQPPQDHAIIIERPPSILYEKRTRTQAEAEFISSDLETADLPNSPDHSSLAGPTSEDTATSAMPQAVFGGPSFRGGRVFYDTTTDSTDGDSDSNASDG